MNGNPKKRIERHRLMLVIFLAAVAAMASLASSSQQQHNQSGHRQSSHEQVNIALTPTMLMRVGGWIDANREDIEPVSTAVVALFTFTLWWSTYGLLKGGKEQAELTRASIKEAATAATAMESLARSMATNVEHIKATVATNREIADRQKQIGELQTRAYVVALYNNTVPQDNQTAVRFEPTMNVVSSGLTPAYELRYRAAADVLAFPPPPRFTFPLPKQRKADGTGMLGPKNNFIISAVVPRIYTAVEVAELLAGRTKRLYIWGIVSYRDAFGDKRTVKFSQSIIWFPNGSTMGINTARHNNAN